MIGGELGFEIAQVMAAVELEATEFTSIGISAVFGVRKSTNSLKPMEKWILSQVPKFTELSFDRHFPPPPSDSWIIIGIQQNIYRPINKGIQDISLQLGWRQLRSDRKLHWHKIITVPS